MPKRVAILIGNGTFHDPEELPDLRGPETDVTQLRRVLSAEDRGGFEPVIALIDKEHHVILKHLERQLRSATREDMVLIYYSGHGKRNANGHLCLATADTRVEILNTSSIPFVNVKQLTEDSECDNVIMILDCCFSGAVSSAYGLKGSVSDQLASIAQETSGLHIFTSSASYQPSREREHERDGTVMGEFTRCLVDGLSSGEADTDEDGVIRLSELKSYVQKQLRGQTAQYWGFRVHGDPVIAMNPDQAQARRAEAALRRMAEWRREGKLPNDVFFAAVDYLREEGGEGGGREHLIGLLTDPRCHPHHFLADWELNSPGAARAGLQVRKAAESRAERTRSTAEPPERRRDARRAEDREKGGQTNAPAAGEGANPADVAPRPAVPDTPPEFATLQKFGIGAGLVIFGAVIGSALATNGTQTDTGYEGFADTSAVTPGTVSVPVVVPVADTVVTTTTTYDTVWGGMDTVAGTP